MTASSGLNSWENHCLADIATPDSNSRTANVMCPGHAGKDRSSMWNLGSLQEEEEWMLHRQKTKNKKQKPQDHFNTLYFIERKWASQHMQQSASDLGKFVILTLTLQDVCGAVRPRITGNEYSLSVTRFIPWLISNSSLISFLYFLHICFHQWQTVRQDNGRITSGCSEHRDKFKDV